MLLRCDGVDMARRALLTDGERDALQNPEERDNPYVVVSRIRRKISGRLQEDIDILQEHHPQLHQELRDVVCE